MEYYFEQWVSGTLEDDPLPVGVRFINFIITEYKDRFELAFTASENPFEISYPDMYYPLEAQCFFCDKYFKIRPHSRQNIYAITKKLILDFCAKEKNNIHFCPNGRSGFENMTISLGFRGKKANFLVKL